MIVDYVCFFCFNDTATTEIYTLSLHDALPIFHRPGDPAHVAGRGDPPDGVGGTRRDRGVPVPRPARPAADPRRHHADRKSTRLNSSHANISYAVFCLKKKNKPQITTLDHTLYS